MEGAAGGTVLNLRQPSLVVMQPSRLGAVGVHVVGEHGPLICFVVDPDGYRIELIDAG